MAHQQTGSQSGSPENDTPEQPSFLAAQEPQRMFSVYFPNVAFLLFFIVILSFSRLYSYLLFHSLVEIFTISISFTILILVWNSRRLLENGYLMFLGTGFAAAACIDLVHSLAYKGMNIFIGYDTNLPTQLWIIARYIQAFTLLTAPFACRKRLNLQLIIVFYTAISLLLVWASLSGNFPDCYREGAGLTRFKIVSEYLIVAIMLASIYLLRRIRSSLDENTYRLIVASVIASICAELAFTTYISVFGFANMVGHFCKLAAYFLIYRALFVTGIRDPFGILFRELKQTEQMLRDKQQRLDAIISAANVGIWEWNVRTGETIFNERWAEILGYTLEEISPVSIKTWLRFAHPADLEASNARLQEHFRGELEFYHVEARMRHKDGHWVWVLDRGKVTTWTEDGKPLLMHGTHTDITQRRQAEDIRTFLAQTSSGTTGEPFFNTLARYLAQSLQMDFVCIDRLEGDGLTARTVAVWHDGHFEDNVTYALKDTPCGDVVEKAVCCFPRDVTQLFPHDEVLKDLRANSYVGVTLQGHTGEPIGLIAVISRSPLENQHLAEEALQLVAVRAAGEMERLDAEAALRASEEKFRAIFEQAGVGAAIIDSTTGRFLQSNKRFANILGLGIDEILTKTSIDITHPDDLQADLDNMEKLRDGRVSEIWMEQRYLHKNGATVWVALTVSPLWPDGSKAGQHIAMVSDITDRKLMEEALQERVQRYELFMTGSSGGAWDWDVPNRRVQYSLGWKRMRGYGDTEIGDSETEWSANIHPDDTPRVMAAVQAHFAGKTDFFEEEYRIQHKDGSWRYIIDRGKAICNDKGAVVRMVGSEIDITERKRAEEELCNAEALLRLSVSASNIGLWRWNPVTGEVHYSREWKSLLGYAENEIPNHFEEWQSRVHPADIGPSMAQLQRYLADSTENYAIEFRMRHKDGSYRWIVAQAQIFRDEAAKPFRVMGCHIDISSRKLLEEELQKREHELEEAQYLAGTGSWVYNPADKVTSWSKGMYRIWGLDPSPGPFSVNDYKVYIHPDDFPRFNSALKNAVEHSIPFTLEMRINRPDGVEKTIINICEPQCGSEGKVVRLRGTNQDITVLKQAETALKASLKEKEVLLREVHHRVKNNLAAIKGLLDMQREDMSKNASIDCFQDLSDRILAMSLVHERLYRSENVAGIDFQDYLSDLTTQLLMSYGAQPHISCILDAGGIELSLEDAVPLGLIVNELVTNAVKHAFPAKKPAKKEHCCEIRVGMKKDGDTLTLTVADNGVGLPPALDWKDCPSLGLRLIRMLSEYQLGGQVQLDQKEGVCFTLLFKDRTGGASTG